MTLDVPMFSHGYGRQLLYDILNDSHDVMERKTGSFVLQASDGRLKFSSS